ncbi:hypothetical protein PR048_008760 [Dryococelus australis]|uniref:Reverse transcriptase domain-containing protein n=1 Tax=Dryococelus australis TaxID=614101 RepID=A0ABQ9HY09_9NEOP|nr:hypothetical protein PR048_008760 [Dryococelus australis]
MPHSRSPLLEVSTGLATTQECSGETGWSLGPPRRITGVGEDSRWQSKILYILTKPSGRHALTEAAWRVCASYTAVLRRTDFSIRMKLQCHCLFFGVWQVGPCRSFYLVHQHLASRVVAGTTCSSHQQLKHCATQTSELATACDEFEDYLISTGQEMSADKVKVSLLRNMMGNASAHVLSSLPSSEEDHGNYGKVKAAIEKYLNPRVNKVFEDTSSLNVYRRKERPLTTFYIPSTAHVQLAVSSIGAQSEVNNNTGAARRESAEDKMLRYCVVDGIWDKAVQEALLRMENLTLDRAVFQCRTLQIQQIHSKSGSAMSEYAVDSVNKCVPCLIAVPNTKRRGSLRTGIAVQAGIQTCSNVVDVSPHMCTRCGLLNHFAKSCWVKNVIVVDQCDVSSSDEFLYCSSVQVCLNVVNTNKSKGIGNDKLQWNNMTYPNEWLEKMTIVQKDVIVSILPLIIFKKVNSQFKEDHTKIKLKTLDGVVKPWGKVNLCCPVKGKEAYIDFMIVDLNVMPLLGLSGCLALNLLQKVEPMVLLSAKEKFVEENTDVFKGLGCFPQKCQILTKLGAEPMCRPPQGVPLTVWQKLQELHRLVEKHVIEKVEKVDVKAWISNLVVIEKPTSKLKLCLDPSNLNRNIVRKHYIVFKIGEICEKMEGKKYFTVFDLRERGFTSPFGTCRYLKMPYGMCSAPEIFQHLVEQNFGDILNTVIYFDELMCMGEDEESHDESVHQLMERARALNVKFNKDKLQYKLTEVKYVGHLFSAEGMKGGKKKQLNLAPLTNKKELQRVIGMFNYVRNLVPDMSHTMAPLCELLKAGITWQWLATHQKATICSLTLNTRDGWSVESVIVCVLSYMVRNNLLNPQPVFLSPFCYPGKPPSDEN